MSLSSASNTINALGIFGRLDPQQEKFFQELSDKYSAFPDNEDSKGIFNHLTLALGTDVPISRVAKYIDVLAALKPYLPLKLIISDIFIKDDLHVALFFDTSQTQVIRDIATALVPEGVVITDYTKVVWFVPEENRQYVINELKQVTEMNFYDFKLVANRQDDANTLYSSNMYK